MFAASEAVVATAIYSAFSWLTMNHVYNIVSYLGQIPLLFASKGSMCRCSEKCIPEHECVHEHGHI